ncbi:MAG: 5'-3' exonuclease H3TH domain-containing protein [Halofilum sp. (in: g-proteobacteria)]|nr:5'-3' exonuclease H3TH domain-containing protein [Halofilum sp. (in: g-proteobacteria)]
MVPARLYLVDASIYVFRAWHVLPDSIRDAHDEPANAVHGFADFLRRFLDEARPARVAVAFDESLESSIRNDIYPDYKANRAPAPEELRRQFARCRELVEAAGLAAFSSPHYEADDLLATLAASMRGHGLRHTVVTGDKDLAQLVRTGDEWWDFARAVRLDVRGIEKRFGVAPHRIPDLLALAGDKIDNIPGVPGIGQATAARLLARWGDLDTLFANLEGVRAMRFRGAARVAALLAEHEATVRLARRLTGMLSVDGLPGEPAALERRAADADALDDLFARLAFGRERRRRWQETLAAPAA